ncbi:MAG: acetyl-CoA carboxylase biotin carboxyl carrier protein subunit [Phycisphaerae bacterium]|jgi:biotin carboxyl carrier protein|nr:MAG: acetyl-CoA carboxylase biotin carboxyl carrier protein subunit [Phycisphaerae bacterium]
MKLRITLEGKTYEVEVEVVEEGSSGPLYGSTSVHSTTIPAPVVPKPPSTPPSPPPVSAPTTLPGERVVKAPIVGTVLQLKVAPGDTVSVNQVLLVMEAMKMETNVASPIAGKVKAIRVSNGESVKAGQVLVEFE